MKDYTVIVYPVKPQPGQSWSSSNAWMPRVTTIRARDPRAAAGAAKVGPGERCEVVLESRHFSRATEAPLEEVGVNGSPRSTAAPA